MERTKDLLKIFRGAEDEKHKDVTGTDEIKELLVYVCDLLYDGFEKLNSVETVREVGEILGDYHDEALEGEEGGFLTYLFRLQRD